MRRKKTIGLSVGICLLLFWLFCNTSVFAAVTEGKAGETLTGEYAVIVNTDPEAAHNTGTLVFDDGADGTAPYTVGSEGASNGLGIVNAAGGSTSSLGESSLSGVNTGVSAPAKSLAAANPGKSAYLVQAGSTNSAIALQPATTYTIGQEKYMGQTYSQKTYVCIGAGEHCYIWMEKNMKSAYDSAGKTALIAADMASVYDGQPYRILNQLAGGEIPCLDGSGKLSILLESLSSASGMYMYESDVTAIHINIPVAASYVTGEMSRRNGLLVHEGQHAVLALKTNFSNSGKYMWLNEGLAVTVMDYLWGGIDSSGWLSGIAESTAIRGGSSLIYQTYRNDTARDYGLPYLFVRYVIDRMAGGYDPMAVLPQFYQVNASGLNSQEYLEKVTGVPFKTLLTDFYTAVAAGEISGVYSFYGDRLAAQKAATYPVFAGDSGVNYSLASTAAIVIKLKDGKFTVPSNGDSSIVYRVIGTRNPSASPAGGNGTAEKPYEIDSLEDLNMISDHAGVYYRLTDDIQTNGKINLSVNYFGGVLDGNGHTISGLKKPLTVQNAGTIKNLRVAAEFDDDSQNAQGVFAQYNIGKIQECTVFGTVTGHMGGQGLQEFPKFGGFAGENSGTISGCSSKLTINLAMPAMKSWVGGIAGLNKGVIEKCISSGKITVTQTDSAQQPVYVGGIAGGTERTTLGNSSIRVCAHTGTLQVKGENTVVGQICGGMTSAVVTDCYGKDSQGKLIGSATETDSNGKLLTEAQLKNSASYTNWKFGTEWKISEEGIPSRMEAADITSISAALYSYSYCIGERPYSWGMVYVNGQPGGIDITDDMISGFDNTTAGTKTIYITYKGKTASCSITITEPDSSKISRVQISRVPKTSYMEGDLFDPSGMSLYVTYSTYMGAWVYSDFTYDKTGPLTTEDTVVTFDYHGFKVQQKITVTAKKPSKLTVFTAPNKIDYSVGDKLDLTGLKFRLTYSNGSQSPVFTAAQLDAYGVKIALGNNGKVTPVTAGKVLTADDNGQTLLFYATDNLPGTYGTVTAVSEIITVNTPLSISGVELCLTAGKAEMQYIDSGVIEGGSGQYTTTVISEDLPEGLERTHMPGLSYTFSYSGVVTAPTGTYVSRYEVQDVQTKAVLPVTITIRVQGASEAAFASFNLYKLQNPVLEKDVIGEIDSVARTITLRIPKGTDVSKLTPNIDYGAGAGTSLDWAFANGTSHDFTNPVEYVLTAPDGVTKKTYTVSVVFYDDSQVEPEPTATPTPNPTNTPVPTATPTPTPTNTPVPTATPTPTNTPVPTATPTPVPTNTPVPTATPTPVPTNTPVPTATPTPVPTATPTPVPTATPTPVPTNTPVPSATPTPVPTNTPVPTATPTPVPTNTPVPTATPKPTSTPVPTATPTPKPKPTSTPVPKPTSTPAPAGYKVGMTVKQQKTNGYYKVTSAQTVEYLRPVNKKASTVVIPDSVNLNGANYKVTSVGTKAFKNNKYLKKLTIGNNVVQIKNYAFYKCTKLNTVKIGKAVQYIGKQSFYGCKKISTMRIYTSRLKQKNIGSNAFKGTPSRMKVYTPRKLVKSYKSIFIKRGMSKSIVMKKL